MAPVTYPNPASAYPFSQPLSGVEGEILNVLELAQSDWGKMELATPARLSVPRLAAAISPGKRCQLAVDY